MSSVHARGVGETEITTEEGIEVFQNEKYYLLKKNVEISSDSFKLNGDTVKIHFDIDLYDIKKIEAFGNVKLDSSIYKLKASGLELFFTVDEEEIIISGKNSKLITNDADMYSDGKIEVNNKNGAFKISGENSSLKNEEILIIGDYIDGKKSLFQNDNEINLLNVLDDEISYIKTTDTEMWANIINYNKETSIIELKENVKIMRNGEIITGDYGTLNTKSNSYKVKSNNSNKVTVIISNQDE